MNSAVPYFFSPLPNSEDSKLGNLIYFLNWPKNLDVCAIILHRLMMTRAMKNGLHLVIVLTLIFCSSHSFLPWFLLFFLCILFDSLTGPNILCGSKYLHNWFATIVFWVCKSHQIAVRDSSSLLTLPFFFTYSICWITLFNSSVSLLTSSFKI